ncbi:MAG: CDP-diacylglycerol--glycerol-3-phosphate 3-phosphatidyltransferase [Chlorobiales bacterium]|nr:CDP-diacylglycerol--glycerol-3-phosphate 3-phosphatidyltransferase [Chlorobiales bacterium]
MTLPNQLTALRILLVPVFMFLLLLDSPYMKLLGVVVFVAASLTDIYDGYHARKYGLTSRLGAFLDPLADKFLITAAFLIYVWEGYLSLWMVLLVVLRDVVVTVLRVYAEWKNKPVVTSREAKYKTITQNVFAYVIMLLILLKEKEFTGEDISALVKRVLHSDYLDYIMLLITLYTVYTGISYLVQNWRGLSSPSPSR